MPAAQEGMEGTPMAAQETMAAQNTYDQARAAHAPVGLDADYIAIDPRYQLAKRLLDIAVSLFILIPLSVFTLAMVIVIRLDSPGPALFRQRRVGARGNEFTLLKLRSMTQGCDDTAHRAAYAEFMRGDVERQEGASDGPCARGKVHDDPRITRVGRFIRKTSLDELPQFWNVLLGQMTLVGPRPPLPYEVANYSPHDLLRLSGKPGLTGPWQVCTRNTVSFHEMIEIDIAYLKRQSLWEDIKLIVSTVPAMLRAQGV